MKPANLEEFEQLLRQYNQCFYDRVDGYIVRSYSKNSELL